MKRIIMKRAVISTMFVLVFLILGPSFAGNALGQVTKGWLKMYNGPADSYDEATAIAIDSSDNIYVTGRSGLAGDFATIKYDKDGNELWVKLFNGPADSYDEAKAIAIDSSDNVYVTGISSGIGTAEDYATIKYDKDGNELWVKRYDGPESENDLPVAIAIDSSDNVYVTGLSIGIGTAEDYATIKYDKDGNELWVKRYNDPADSYDEATSIAIDSSDNVYVTGGTAGDFATIKYDKDGNELWVKLYNGPANGPDVSVAIAIDSSDNVYITGLSEAIDTWADYATIKYDKNGNELWVKRYDGPESGGDYPSAIAIDSSDNVYITGESYGILLWRADYATIKYNKDGNELWVKRYNGSADSDDAAKAIAIDSSDNVYVTGYSYGIGTAGDFATIKYDKDGNELWVKWYNGSDDVPAAIAIDSSDYVYLTGCSYSYPGSDYVTIKYVKGTGTGGPGAFIGAGSGTVNDPYQITNVIQLQEMAYDLSAHYVLVNDINASETINWNWIIEEGIPPWEQYPYEDYGIEYLGFEPIDNFIGTFDGQNYKITGLYTGRVGEGEVGLFGFTDSGAEIKNVGLVDVNILGDNTAGGLVGHNYGGTITNCSVTGYVYVYDWIAGGLVGENQEGTITDCHTTGNVFAYERAGGLVGSIYAGIINNCYSNATVGAVFDPETGELKESTWHISGGLVGCNFSGLISNSYATGDVRCDGDEVGGLVGEVGDSGGIISNCYATGRVTGWSYYVGGLVGNNSGLISDSYATGDVWGVEDTAGGLVGYNAGAINNTYATNCVTGWRYVGGLVGENAGTISSSYATGYVWCEDEVAGGLIGENVYGAINNTYATGRVTGWAYVGGLIGSSWGGEETLISNSYATGDVNTWEGNGEIVGGLVGSNCGAISNTYATGSVTGWHYIGGLVGENDGTISNSYAIGDVWSEEAAGGLVGYNYATISNCFATGSVSGSWAVGGLIGLEYNDPEEFIEFIINNYWYDKTDDEAYYFIGEPDISGMSEEELAGICTKVENVEYFYDNSNPPMDFWDFVDVWGIDVGAGYPWLKYFQVNTPVGDDVTVDIGSGVTTAFSEVTVAGNTTVTVTETGPELPAGFELLGQYYDIATTAEYTGPVTVVIEYDDTGLSPEEEVALQLMHYEEREGAWNWYNVTDTGYPDTENNIIRGTVSGLSLFAVVIANMAPIPDAGDNIQILSANQTYTVIQGTATDPDGDPLQYRWLEADQILLDWTTVGPNSEAYLDVGTLPYLAIGDHTLTLEVNDGLFTASDEMILTIENSPPEAQPAPSNQVVEIGLDPIVVVADVADFDGDTLSYEWLKDGEVLASGTVTTIQGGEAVPIPDLNVSVGDPRFPLGVHQIELKVSDGINNPVSAFVSVEVIDTTAPSLSPVPSVTILWPPNHQLQPVTIVANAFDNGGGITNLGVTVQSSEPPDTDGNTIPDYYVDSVNNETGIIELRLRAERQGKGDGRTYTITITATDTSGNQSVATVEILAPHDRRKK
jgi:hypothetical protein